MLADAATSALAIVALVGGLWWGWAWLDPVMGLVGAVLVARWSWALVRDTARSLLDAEMDHPLALAITNTLRDQAPWSGHVQLRRLRVWRVGGARYAVMLQMNSQVPWVTPDAVRRALAGFPEIEILNIEISQG